MIILLTCLAVVLGALYAFQRKLIYLPNRLSREDFEDTVKGAFDDRVSVLAPFDAIVFEPPPTVTVRGTAILFHGNAGLGLDRAYLVPTFARRGLRLILAEYPGYGARGGAPTERTLVDDADALYVKVSRAYPNSPIALVGESLGGGVAVQVAAREAARPPSRLVLVTPWLSLAETAARAYPFLPARYLVKDRFDSAGRLPRYTGPVAILVAERDEVVGAAQGRALAQLARSRGETVYVELPEAGHNSWTALMTDAQWTDLLGLAPVPGRL
jgi:alpha-beta hydrolase superfamily lysophospholipase